MPTAAPKETGDKVKVLGRIRRVFLSAGKKWVLVKGKLVRLVQAKEQEKKEAKAAKATASKK